MCPPPTMVERAVPTPLVGAKHVPEAVAVSPVTEKLENNVTVGESPEAAVASKLVAELVADKTKAVEVGRLVKERTVTFCKDALLIQKLQELLDGKSATAREAALLALVSLMDAAGLQAEPFVEPLLPVILTLAGDKVASVRLAAELAAKKFVAHMNVHAVSTILPIFLAAMEPKNTWQTKVLACELVCVLSNNARKQVAIAMPTVFPSVSHTVSDAKIQVKTAAMKALEKLCSVVGNKDIETALPKIMSSIANPTEVTQCVHLLSATTFVQAVEAPALSVMVPLLLRGLRTRETAIKRKSALIIDNMSKLVENPVDAAVFLPQLLPDLEKVSTDVSDPECRSVCERARATLERIGGSGLAKKQAEQAVPAQVQQILVGALGSDADKVDIAVLAYVSSLASHLIDAKHFDKADWVAISTYLAPFLGEENVAGVAEKFLEQCLRDVEARQSLVEDFWHDDSPHEELCACEFSLAYGGMILLNNTRFVLKRGKRYGLCGPNGCGKSTLMRSIAEGKVDGFPPKEVLRTVYVEHDIDAEEADTCVVDFVVEDESLKSLHSSKEEIVNVLGSVGFTPDMLQQSVGSLSGGWKMKLALARAMLMRADIMLLDEPTNHLDVYNVQWLEDYLTGLSQVTSIIVSHDSGFLDNVCTDIIHYEDRKLKRYAGNLSAFVKAYPAGKTYYELGAAQQKFVLPEPGFLEGIKTKDRAIIKMKDVTFQYPGSSRMQLDGVTLNCSMLSRVAVIGPNGAGKSTLVKVLTGELEPTTKGSIVYRHPNVRVAYVAQHAFHHIEEHLDKTPNQYIQWRYATGEDREASTKVDRQISAEEEAKMAQAIKQDDGSKKTVEKLLGRRKLKKNYEYEVQWKGCLETTWVSDERLKELGFQKMMTEVDAKEAARAGMALKPLTQANIEKHLQDLGLEPEFGTHSQMRGLSGGQKVKVVLAAAMWQNPHMLVIDEPTNYLDRESLGALANAIKEFGGGVVMISHSKEFTDALCNESWEMKDGKLVGSGGITLPGRGEKIAEAKFEETVKDALGNDVKVKRPKKALSNKEKKKLAKERAYRRSMGEAVTDSDDDE
jgi:elongation factor 3